ncbi:hypothetical protein B0H10DRAFT_1963539 [Mycena sp. CBHHK59/15]|nr:hypothetical protein B0H10DRAFT_1963539 [Mycena sp. CBHHK59/15]
MPSTVTIALPVGTRITSSYANRTENIFREANGGTKEREIKWSLQDGHYAGQNYQHSIPLISQSEAAVSLPHRCNGRRELWKRIILTWKDFSTFVIEYTGNRIGSKQKDQLLAQGCVYIFQVAPREFVDASELNEVNVARYINHSCDPNTVVELWDDPNGLPRALVISKRTIFAGEEITIHYGSDFMPSPCLCAKCIRGVTSSSAGGKVSNTRNG